jgi:hypothetical protein
MISNYRTPQGAAAHPTSSPTEMHCATAPFFKRISDDEEKNDTVKNRHFFKWYDMSFNPANNLYINFKNDAGGKR